MSSTFTRNHYTIRATAKDGSNDPKEGESFLSTVALEKVLEKEVPGLKMVPNYRDPPKTPLPQVAVQVESFTYHYEVGVNLLKAVYCKAVDMGVACRRYHEETTDLASLPLPKFNWDISDSTDEERIAVGKNITHMDLYKSLSGLIRYYCGSASRREPFPSSQDILSVLAKVMTFKGDPTLRGTDQKSSYWTLVDEIMMLMPSY